MDRTALGLGLRVAACAAMATSKRPPKKTKRSLKRRAEVTLRYRVDGTVHEIAVPLPADMPRIAMRWASIARIRRRWRDSDHVDKNPLAESLNDYDVMRSLGRADVIEISIPFASSFQGWEARIFPWEWLLSDLVQPFQQGDRKPTVIRHLDCVPDNALTASDGPIYIVESAPKDIARDYDLASERRLVAGMLGRDPKDVPHSLDPSLQQLIEMVRELQPGLIHIAGIDSHQAAELMPEIRPSDSPDWQVLDGMSLRSPEDPTRRRRATSDDSEIEAMRAKIDSRLLVRAEDAATVLADAARKPFLVSFNLYNSAARLAALTVAEGARAAIGFQDTIDDGVAEQFFAALYYALAVDERSLVDAFTTAVEAARESSWGLQGACIVLWTRESVFASSEKRTSKRAALALSPPAVPRAPADAPVRARIRVDCLAAREVNYALLQNGNSPFEKLHVWRKNFDGDVCDIRVAVTLFVGQDSFPYVTTFDLEAHQVGRSLARDVTIPLTSTLIRTEAERMTSTLRVEVTCGKETVFENTLTVILSPVDEWTDTDESRQWLPSFVLPRDPAVARIIESAQRYLMAITDDPAAGFDGYQSVGTNDKESIDRRCEPVDLQVRAIWSALVHEHRLSYINPPPSYGDGTQRLRMPSVILGDRRGTCIDLALLVCACLELIDIYPVVFLLEGHAFPGYWRGDYFHEQFRSADTVGSAEVRSGMSARNQTAYTVDREGYVEVRDLVHEGKIVPLETVWLTNYSGFQEAVVEGERNLRSRLEFHSMIDITLARRSGVTPLPMVGRGA